MSGSAIKLCRDCVSFAPNVDDPEAATCKRTRGAVQTVAQKYVLGGFSGLEKECRDERVSLLIAACGPEAKFWEAL